MQNQFVNMVPAVENMVTEVCDDDRCLFKGTALDILCVECGWSGHFNDGSTDHFFNHKCRLVSQMASTSD